MCECLSLFLFIPKAASPLKTLSVKNESVQSHHQHSHEKMYLLDLIQFDRMQSLEMKSSTLTGCQSHFCFISFSGLVTQTVTSEGDLWSPGVPSRWPYAGPRTQLNTGERPSSCQDKRANIPCSPLMSPAKRTGSTLGPLGFIYPFFLASQRVDRGVKFVRCLGCDRLTTSHTQRSLSHSPKSFMMHSPDSRCQFSCSPLATEALCLRKISGRNKTVPGYTLKAFFKKPLHVNAVSQAREQVKLKGLLPVFSEPQEGNSSAVGDPELCSYKRGERDELTVKQGNKT